MRILLTLIFLVLWSSFHARSQVRVPLTYKELSTALIAKLPRGYPETQRIPLIIDLISRRGVKERLTSDRETALRRLGATDGLILAIKNHEISASGINSVQAPASSTAISPIITFEMIRQFARWEAMLARSEYNSVIRETTLAITQNAGNVVALRMRAEARFNSRQNLDVLEDSKAIVNVLINPLAAEDWAVRCLANGNIGKIDLGISDCSKAIVLNPQFVMAYKDRGVLHDAKGDHDKAIDDFSKALEIDPSYADGYFSRGFSYLQKKHFDLAIPDFTRAIEIIPRDFEAYLVRGKAFLGLNKTEQAISDFTKAIEINSKYAAAYDARADVYEKSGQVDKAKADRAMSLKLSR